MESQEHKLFILVQLVKTMLDETELSNMMTDIPESSPDYIKAKDQFENLTDRYYE